MQKKNLIFNAFAFDEELGRGPNMIVKNTNKYVESYLKISAVSLISSKINNPNDEVAIITNGELPTRYKVLLEKHGVKIFQVPFSSFRFPKETKWGLAYYKLCALDYVVNQLEYEKYLLIDTDTYVQSSLEYLWEEATQKLLLYDVGYSIQYEVMSEMNEEFYKLYGIKKYLTMYGGEFICGNASDLKMLIEKCKTIYDFMISKNFVSVYGDQFILACASEYFRETIKNAAPYVFRYLTGMKYVITTNYNSIPVFHLMSEKNISLPFVFRYIEKKGCLPKRKKLHKIFRIKKSSPPLSIHFILYLLKRFRQSSRG